MTERKRRFKVQYALRDGNAYDTFLLPLYFLRFAQQYAEFIREEHQQEHLDSVIFITDLENPERGDLSAEDPDEYQPS